MAKSSKKAVIKTATIEQIVKFAHSKVVEAILSDCIPPVDGYLLSAVKSETAATRSRALTLAHSLITHGIESWDFEAMAQALSSHNTAVMRLLFEASRAAMPCEKKSEGCPCAMLVFSSITGDILSGISLQDAIKSTLEMVEESTSLISALREFWSVLGIDTDRDGCPLLW